MTLRPELWRDQEHIPQTDSMIHFRHMNSICESFSTGIYLLDQRDSSPQTALTRARSAGSMPRQADYAKKNMVLFVSSALHGRLAPFPHWLTLMFSQAPYLHWEKDRQRQAIADKVHERCERRSEDLRNQWRDGMAKAREGGVKPLLPRIRHQDERFQDREHGLQPIRPCFEDAAMEMVKRVRDNKADSRSREAMNAQAGRASRLFSRVWSRGDRGEAIVRRRKPGRTLEAATVLGQYLLDAAFLYETMARYPDVRLLKQFLFCDPEVGKDYPYYPRPLQPRRTLDQADILKLKSTRHLDRDQVVYRHTKANFIHKFKPRTGTAEQQSGQPKLPTPGAGRMVPDDSETEWHWTGHGVYEDEYGCSRCLEDISKLARVIMVDQLWMWILDEQTILTCFPQRYGIVGTDHSGVHHTIITRLKNQFDHANRIRSVWELGLVILRGCFNTIFDRTKGPDARPAVMDIFAESMGQVVRLQELRLPTRANMSTMLTTGRRAARRLRPRTCGNS